ncbi:MAG TPA: AraC family transcriptional regulator [Armatimonadota bacterium]|nr:AraC family transcriptional regulator [Armatimonadota bacterium]
MIAVPHDAALEYTIRSYAEEIAAGKTADLPMECGIKAVIFTALGRYLQSVPAAQMERYQQMTKNLQPILPAITYLENHYDERLSNEMLAELCCVTPEHFIRRFHRCTGMTPVKYLQEHRVRIAAQYLLFSERSIEDIATCTGFGNRAYFTRIFTRITGFSPAAYRRTLRT